VPAQKPPLPPPLEYAAILLTLLFFDEERFIAIQVCCTVQSA
jgi:hypothetical protein